MEKEENILGDFEDKYLKTKKKNRILLLFIILLIIIIIILVIVFINSKSGDQGQENINSDMSNQCPVIKEVIGGLIGHGYITRHWNCCKPFCSSTQNAGVSNEARQCDANMNIITDKHAVSICEGGPSTMCLSQIPFTIEGCNNMGFAFAAFSGRNNCGKCFLLEFTGKGKDVQRNHYKLLKPKKLIVMVLNLDYTDENEENQPFTIMIPGGGTGNPNRCSSVLGDNLGVPYGGLLGECAEEIGYDPDDNIIYTKRKECLIQKCNDVFSNITEAREGCLFLANFFEVASDPLHNYKEIECPQVLKDRYY